MIGHNGAELQRGLLKAADHRSGQRRRQWENSASDCRFSGLFCSPPSAATGLVVLAAAFVPPQTLFYPNRCLFRAVIGIGCHPFRLEQCTGIKMQNTFCSETKAVLADRGMA